MNVVELIRRKREGLALPAADVRAFVAGYTDGSIPDYQAAALLMACFLKGLDGAEQAALTDAMLHSGDVLDLSGNRSHTRVRPDSRDERRSAESGWQGSGRSQRLL